MVQAKRLVASLETSFAAGGEPGEAILRSLGVKARILMLAMT